MEELYNGTVLSTLRYRCHSLLTLLQLITVWEHARWRTHSSQISPAAFVASPDLVW